MCAFNYRFVPAVRLAREIIEAGELGEIHHFRGSYLQEWGTTTERGLALRQGRRGLGRARRPRRARDRPRPLPRRRDRRRSSALDARRSSPGARSTTPSRRRCAFEGGAVGTIEATRFATGRKNAFTLGDQRHQGLDRASTSSASTSSRSTSPARRRARRSQGFRTVLVSEADHPFWEHWWPHGPHHRLGAHLRARAPPPARPRSATTATSRPHGATLEDGYRAAEVCDAMLRSAESGARETVPYRDLMADARFEGRRALVTGAGSGIGEAVARALHAEGADVVLADAAGERVRGAGRRARRARARPLALDVRDEDAVAAAMGELDVLVNVAGIGSTTSAPDTPLEVWENVFAVNARGTFLCCKHAIPGMIERGGGAIVNIASVAGLVGPAQPRRLLRVEGRGHRPHPRAGHRPRRPGRPRQRRLPGHGRLAVGAAPRRRGRRVARRAARPPADGPPGHAPRRSPRPCSTSPPTPPPSSPGRGSSSTAA